MPPRDTYRPAPGAQPRSGGRVSRRRLLVAQVDACDLSAAMVRRGRARCADLVTWRQADAQDLAEYGDARFDVVASAFGAACAPHPRRVAAELARVCRPGGRVVLAAWVPPGLPGRVPELAERWTHRPRASPRRATGDVPRAQARPAPHLERLTLRTYVLSVLRRATGLLLRDGALDIRRSACAALRPGFERLLASVNNRPSAVEIDARYLVAGGIVRG